MPLGDEGARKLLRSRRQFGKEFDHEESRSVPRAAIQDFGQVYDCGSSGNIHAQVGPLNITLEPKACMQLAAMISTSAANFRALAPAEEGH